jgi:RNA polymerase sigma-70 factor (ECF subfamily)
METQLSRDEAIPKLLEEHGGMVFSLGRRMCNSAEEAEDLVQETFLQAYRSWSQFEGRSTVKTWLYTIAMRTCQRLQRKRVGQPARMSSLESLLPMGEATMGVLDTEADSPLDMQMRMEGKQQIEEAIVELPIEFRVPLILKDILGFSIKEVAEITEIKVATVKTRVHRARLRLRQAMESILPRAEVPPAEYPMQVCMDLLRLKQESIDRGDEANAKLDNLVCRRCNILFTTMDCAFDACQELLEGRMPSELRDRILMHFQSEADHN